MLKRVFHARVNESLTHYKKPPLERLLEKRVTQLDFRVGLRAVKSRKRIKKNSTVGRENEALDR
jgi:hypothetical protein